MRFELDRIAAAHLAQVLMCPQIPHIGGGTGLHTKVTDEIDAVDIRFIFPVEKTYYSLRQEVVRPSGNCSWS